MVREVSLKRNKLIPHSRPWITLEDRRAVNEVLRSGLLAQGDVVKRLEQRVAKFVQVFEGVAVGSGTAAIELVLRAMRLPKNAEVVIPTYVCRNVLEAVLAAGATPVLCDVGADWTITRGSVSPYISRRSAAIIAVHTFGIPADVNDLKAFGIPVIEDACQALGAHIAGRPVGSMGLAGVFSFHGTKCITSGEGGIIVTDNPELLKNMRQLRDGGAIGKKWTRLASPMSDIQAGLAMSQLRRYPQFLARRAHIARRYRFKLFDTPVTVPDVTNGRIYFRFPVRSPEGFQAVQEIFARMGVTIRRGVDALLHRELGKKREEYRMSERLFQETISLPIYPSLSRAEQDRVIAASYKAWPVHG